MTVIAGRAAPGARVSVISNGAEVASAQADRSGKFATLAILPPDGSGMILSLSADAETGPVASVEEVILAPITAPAVVSLGAVVVCAGGWAAGFGWAAVSFAVSGTTGPASCDQIYPATATATTSAAPAN